MKLHLGCGNNYLGGYVNIDLPVSGQTVMRANADVYADIRTLTYPDNSIDEIRSHHLFEHFPRAEGLQLLFQWRRWLKPGGMVRIETPDFETAANMFKWVPLKQKFKIARHIFGSQEADWAVHKDWFGKAKWQYVLSRLGFERIVCVEKTEYTRRTQGAFCHMRGGISLRIIRVFPWIASWFGFDPLHNITVTAIKSRTAIDEHLAVQEILSLSLIGDEQKILDVWKKEI